jgi:DNA topoisomerase-1
MTNLLIVESPSKCNTIQSYLGDGWVVKASFGHVRDLPKKEMGVDLESFQPQYVANEKSKKVLAGLRKLCRSSNQVWLATDPDREGEAIAWHLQEALHLNNPIRVSYNEITKKAISEAIKNPGHIDRDRVKAQEGRRVLDRLVGYSVSPSLTRACGNETWLTAGRVQSVALRLVVERELAIKNFVPTAYVEVWLQFNTEGISWKAQWRPGTLLPEGQKHWTDREFAERVAQLSDMVVVSVETKRRTRRSPPPFITSSLLQAASVTLHMQSDRCMQVAQELFESGLITYHRTDNPNLSDDGLRDVIEWLKQNGYGDDVANPVNRWKVKESAQEGHEAIRPTSFLKPVSYDDMSSDQQRLYSLILKRSIACQMKPAKFNVTLIMLESIEQLDGKNMQFEGRGEQLLYPGWMKLCERDTAVESVDEEKSQQLPAFAERQPLNALEGLVKDKQTKPPPRFTDASLTKKLEDEGIGRPSTYAAILKNIINRGYIEINKRKLSATDLGILIIQTLVDKFKFMEIGYTRELEKQLDAIAAGSNHYFEVVSTAYQDLIHELKSLDGIVVAAQKQYHCSECGKPLRLIQNKFWGCSGYPDCGFTAPNDKGKPGTPKSRIIDESYPCVCGNGYLQRRKSKSRNDNFWGCSNYPECKYTLPDDDGKPGERSEKKSTKACVNQAVGKICPTCQSGQLVLRTIKNGRNQGKKFHGCSNFPECKHFSWANS